MKKYLEKNNMMSVYKHKKDEHVVRFSQIENPYDTYLSKILILPVLSGKSGKILDLGCGAGRNAVTLAKMGFSVTAIDLYSTPLKIAKDHAKQQGVEKKITFIQKDIFKIKKGEYKNFDFVILQDVVEHVENYQGVINVAYGALKPGGILLLSTPRDPKLWTDALDTFANHVRRFTEPQLRQALSKFKSVDLFVTGFPFYRLFAIIYDKYLSIKKKHHDTKEFADNALFYFVYTRLFPFLLKIDHLFDFTGQGTEFIAKAIK